MKTAVDYIDSVLIELIENFNSKEYQVACDTLINFRNVVIEQAKEIEENLAEQFAEFSIMCDRRGWTPRTFKDWVEQYKQ